MSSPIDSNPDPDEREQEAASLHELAESIIVECKQSKPVSSLDAAIFLLGQVLDQQPPGHASRSDTLRHLATGLLARFAHAGHVEDLDQALSLLDEASPGESTIVDESDVVVQDTVTIDHEEQVSMTEIALDALTEFHLVGQLSSVESAVHLYREALLLQSVPNPQHCISLLGLATALIMQFYCEEKLHYLDEVITLLQDIQTFPQFQCLLSLSLCHCLKFMETADIQDIDEAVDLHGKAADEDAEAEERAYDPCLWHGTRVARPCLRHSVSSS